MNSTLNFFKRNPWFLPIIGGLVALISLFTPTTYDKTGTELILIWMNQVAVRKSLFTDSFSIELLRSIIWLNTLSILCAVIIFSTTSILVTTTYFYWKISKSYQKLRWIWLIIAILIVIATLTWIVMMEIAYLDSPQNHWEWYSPHFGVIGPFIGAGLIVIGTFFVRDAVEIKDKEKVFARSNIKRASWFLPIIGGFVALIALFTPVTTWNPPGSFAIQWIDQLGLTLEPDVEFELWRIDPNLLLLSYTLAILIFISTILVITSTTIYKTNSRSFHKIKWVWLVSAILITFSTLTWIIMMELFYREAGGSHWQAYDPNFGVIGPFIGAGLIVLGIFFVNDLKDSK